MSAIREAAAGYLRLRRSTGYKYYVEGLLIGHFVDFLEERRAEHVTAEAALEWAARPADADPAWHAARLTAIRAWPATWPRPTAGTRSRLRACFRAAATA